MKLSRFLRLNELFQKTHAKLVNDFLIDSDFDLTHTETDYFIFETPIKPEQIQSEYHHRPWWKEAPASNVCWIWIDINYIDFEVSWGIDEHMLEEFKIEEG